MTIAVPSIVASLRFAAALLHPEATPQQICTKESLGAIVLDAHRLAQQSAGLKVAVPEPRVILKTMIPRDSSLVRLAFGDISWDFEGKVSETLEIELQDVKERAATSLGRSVCILLTVSKDASPSTVPDTALLWLPYDSNNNAAKKYLLYVVPGRVKVTKSVPELMRKLYEEITSLKANDATYRVWTLMAVSHTSNDESLASKTRLMHQPEVPEDETGPISNHPESKMMTDLLQSGPAGNSTERHQPHTRPPISIRVAKKDLIETESIFSFPREFVNHTPRVSSGVAADLKEVRSIEPTPVAHTSATPLNDEVPHDVVPCPHEHSIDNQTNKMPSIYRGSHNVAASYSGRFREAAVSNQSTSVWRSLDSDIKRLPHDRSENSNFNGDCSDITTRREDCSKEQGADTSMEHPVHGERPKTRCQQAQPRQMPSMFEFSAAERIQFPVSLVHEPHDLAAVSEHEDLGSEKKVHETKVLMKQPEPSAKNVASIPKKKRSARDHYRSKLGAQVWWELEYQATKILQQECYQSSQGQKSNALRPDLARRIHISETKTNEPSRERVTKASSVLSTSSVRQINKEEAQEPVPLVEPNAPLLSSGGTKCMIPDLSTATRAKTNAHDGLVHAASSTTNCSKHKDYELRVGENASRSIESTSPQHEVQSAIREESSRRSIYAARMLESTKCSPARTSQTTAEGHSDPALEPLQSSEKPVFVLKNAHEDEEDMVLMATMVAPPMSHIEKCKPLEYTPEEETTVEDRVQVVPFSGRIPIRAPNANAKPRTSPQKAWHDDSESEEEQALGSASRAVLASETQPRPGRGPPPSATFILVELDAKEQRDNAATADARQRKLAELRQKKLLQLQKARETALGQKKKAHLTTIPPVPIVVAQPSKSSSVLDATVLEIDPSTDSSLVTHANARVRKPSNRKLIQNAIEYTLLAGGSLEKDRVAALQAMAESSCDNFVVLLKSAKELKFRALYEHHVDRNRVIRLFSVASSVPPVLSAEVISQFFRYNSGKKEFAPVDARDFTVKTDACALVDQLVFKKKTALGRLL